MRLAVLGQRLLPRVGCPDICQPVLDRFAHDCREFARPRGRRRQRARVDRPRAGRRRRARLPADQTTEPVPLYATASGKAWLADAAENPTRSSTSRAHGGFRDADRYGPNVIRSADKLCRSCA
jgi:DNA-binding IclR family transcriptional regulator